MRRFATISLCAIAVASPFAADAATWHVPADAPTIQAGLDSASYGDTVLVACGTYYEHGIWAKDGVCLLSETGVADCVTIESTDGRVLKCSGVSSATLIQGFTITGGTAVKGGGMFCRNTWVRVRNCAFIENSVTYPTGHTAAWGGGVYCDDASYPVMENCIFVGNSASTHGGGVCCRWSSAPTFISCAFSGNWAYSIWGGFGGAVCCLEQSAPTFISCTFSGNSSRETGGGAYCEDQSLPILTGCSFAGNSSANGGGMSCFGESSAELTDCTFTENSSGGHGGGMSGGTTETTLLTRCIFSGNSAESSGGGMAWIGETAVLTECTFVGNSAAGHSGALDCRSGSSATVTRCTFSGNSAGWTGGAIGCFLDASLTIDNSILAFSVAGEGLACDETCSPLLRCSDIFGNAGGDWVGCIADQYGENGNFSEDPLFCDMEGGDLRLHCQSPCAPAQQPECGSVGAWDVGCGPTRVESQTTWSRVKSQYRDE